MEHADLIEKVLLERDTRYKMNPELIFTAKAAAATSQSSWREYWLKDASSLSGGKGGGGSGLMNSEVFPKRNDCDWMSGNGGDGLGWVVLEVLPILNDCMICEWEWWGWGWDGMGGLGGLPNLSGSMQIECSNRSLEGFRWTKLCGALKDSFHSKVTARMRQDTHSLQLLPSHTCQAGNLGDGQQVEGIHPASVQDPNPQKKLFKSWSNFCC